jgi:transposase
MAPILFHGLSQLGLPVVCIESRQAYQALKSLATNKTDRNDARGLAHLARTGFFTPVHVKSLPAHALRSLIIARKKLVGQRDDPSRIRRSRDIGAYLGLVPGRHQSGEVDYLGGISKCGDRRVRMLSYETANVMLAAKGR